MSLAAASLPLAPRRDDPAEQWRTFLAGQLDDHWQIGSWDVASGILTVDPFNEFNDLRVCQREGCGNPVATVAFCLSCRRLATRAGLPIEDYAAANPKTDPALRRSTWGFEQCAVRDETGARCGRARSTRNVCVSHYVLLAKQARARGEAVITDAHIAAFVVPTAGRVLHPRVDCRVDSCARFLSRSTALGFCDFHETGFRASRRRDQALTADRYARSDEVLERHQLPLRALPEPMRTELLFVIQQYALRGYGRVMVGKLRPYLDEARHDGAADLLECFRSHDHAVRLRGIRSVGVMLLEKARRQFEGYDSLARDMVFPQDLPLRTTHSHRNPDLTGEPLDMRLLIQPWLAAGFRAWLGATLEPRSTVQRCFETCTEISTTLAAKRSDAGMDGSRLSYDDMAAVVARIEDRWPGARGRSATWWELCRAARALGAWDAVPESFAQHYAGQKRARQRSRADRKVESDRVTPAAVIAHLRAHTAGLDIGRHSDLYRCALELLMETGRRPGEIASLDADCLIQDRHGGWLLRYTAHKTGGSIKELPVETPVADSIRAWQQVRAERGIRARVLFPSGRRRMQDEHVPHIGEHYLGKILKRYITSLPPVPGPVFDVDGVAVDFDLTTVQVYDFRRAYAQRHADNGTDPDVLRQLMDHVSMSTTMGYYQISSKRRRRAVSALAPLAHDRHGKQVGIGKGRLQLKVTPVPYGDCAEPSNVAAGGTACQLRYQCAGCGFFRPNPSHIPEIEKEIIKLRSQLRIAEASDTAGYLLDAQRGLIADYENVLTKMRDRLAQMPETERQEIDTMSDVMRRARNAALAGKLIEVREL
ncbi:site-specific integrase [Microbacterium aerolatum]|uniref:tyrosine-type recombinase/integrase n=1 Tax=Microbacterium aerolatum TaxID=153731 RepID=UPI002001BC67|nr:tyrosine-type recombinase/integrase [Microbacterium aerolatum]MCK3768062.1 site-specific integrase [Microbacterium aerolatum]